MRSDINHGTWLDVQVAVFEKSWFFFPGRDLEIASHIYRPAPFTTAEHPMNDIIKEHLFTIDFDQYRRGGFCKVLN